MRPIVITGAHPASNTAATTTPVTFSFIDASLLPDARRAPGGFNLQ
jgi:hypothetical protein